MTEVRDLYWKVTVARQKKSLLLWIIGSASPESTAQSLSSLVGPQEKGTQVPGPLNSAVSLHSYFTPGTVSGQGRLLKHITSCSGAWNENFARFNFGKTFSIASKWKENSLVPSCPLDAGKKYFISYVYNCNCIWNVTHQDFFLLAVFMQFIP